MKNGVLILLRGCYNSLADEDKHWRKEIIGDLKDAETSKEMIIRLRILLEVLLNSDDISNETKIFIENNEYTAKDVNEELNRRLESAMLTNTNKKTPYSYANTIKRLSEDNNKLLEIINEAFIKDIMYNRISNRNAVDKRIGAIVSKFGSQSKLRENLLIGIDKVEGKRNSYLNNQEFFDILESLQYGLKQRLNVLSRAVNSNVEFVEYFNYLLSTKALMDPQCLIDRERLTKFLKNEDFMTGYVEDEEEEELEDYVSESEIEEDSTDIESEYNEEEEYSTDIEENSTEYDYDDDDID